MYNVVTKKWGRYTNLYVCNSLSDHVTKVKEIVILPGDNISMQKHYNRAEHWFIVQGIASVYSKDKKDELIHLGNFNTHEIFHFDKQEWHLVANEKKEVLAGASIHATHLPTGTQYTTTANKSGVYVLPAVRVGGPYTIHASFVGYKKGEVNEVNTQLGLTSNVDFVLIDEVKALKEVVVSGARNSIFSKERTGAAQQFTRRELMSNTDNIQPMMNEIGEYIDPVVTSPAPRMTQAEADELLRQYNLRRHGTANPIVNKSGLTKDRAIALSPESKSMVESMSDKDFKNTVLSLNKGERKIVSAPNDKGAAIYLLGKNKVKMIPKKDWIDEFNSNLSKLNENIVPKLNRSGASYEFLPMKEIPGLRDHAELGLKSIDKDGKEIVKGWTVKIKPGKFKGEIQDVAGEDYMNSIPGLEMTNSGEGVFDQSLYAPGSNAYRALNDYLKSMDLGRISVRRDWRLYGDGFYRHR